MGTNEIAEVSKKLLTNRLRLPVERKNQVLFVFLASVLTYIKSLNQRGWDRNNLQDFWNLWVSVPLCSCTPVARISLKVCTFSRIFAQRYHHTPWVLLVWVRKSFRLLGSAWS